MVMCATVILDDVRSFVFGALSRREARSIRLTHKQSLDICIGKVKKCAQFMHTDAIV